jgi:undecaprenyl-diphosphatase
MLEKLIHFDIVITNFLKNLLPHNLFFDLFFSFFSLKGNAIFVWILVIIIALFLEEKKHPGISKNDKKFIIAFTLSFLLTAFLVGYPLKNLFNRQRPTLTNLNQLQLVSTNYCPTDFSFPSGHAATAFAATTVLTFFDKKRRFFYHTIALLIAYSRLYLGCHYFLDVLGGGVLGMVISTLILKVFKNLKKCKFLN